EQPQLDPNDPHGRRLLDSGSDKLIDRGYIALQAESHPVEFRKIEILEESDAAADAPPVNLLAGKLDEHWKTTGNWKLGDDGVVKLTPRPGEKGWQRYGAYL